MRLGPEMTPSDALRLAQIAALLFGLGITAFRYAQKHHRGLDELALLLFLACGVNLVVQLTGGARSYWQGLYLVLGGLASLAFPRRLVAAMVAAVLSIETANWLVHPVPSVVDLVRLSLLFLVAVIGYNYMERSERDRAERAEDRLLRLDAGLRQLAGPAEADDDFGLSPLSEDGQRAGQAEQVEKLEQHVLPLLDIARRGSGAEGAVLLQVAADDGSFWVRLASGDDEILQQRFLLRGSIFAETLRSERNVLLEASEEGYRLPWRSSESAVRSVLAIPIRIWDEPPWILVLHHAADQQFSEEKRELARTVARQMKEAQSLFRERARHYVDELELKGLLRASERLTGKTRLGELLHHIVEYVGDVTKFDTCAVCLREEGKDDFSVVVAEGYRKELLGSRFPLEAQTWAGWVLRAREEPVTIRMERRPGMPILDPRERAGAGGSFLAVPLRAQKRISGALLLTRTEPFTARELRLLRIYCNQAAVALDNAFVYERVENLAATDALTGLFNRRYFESALARELARADRTSSQLALLILDIDHFKSFNDTYGHAMGDIVLQRVARVLNATIRKADVLARLGGEEFVVLLPQVTAKGAVESAERLREAVAKGAIHPGGPLNRVTVSTGVAIFPVDAKDGPALLEAADEALYQAKHLGRNRVIVYTAPVARAET
jgi:diguanylate cyclase (GGDEF)-like protein